MFKIRNLRLKWLGRDSILVAPLIIDLVRIMDFVLRRREYDIQSQLVIYFKHPLGTSARDFFDQYMLLKNYYAGIEELLMEPDTHRQMENQPVALEV